LGRTKPDISVSKRPTLIREELPKHRLLSKVGMGIDWDRETGVPENYNQSTFLFFIVDRRAKAIREPGLNRSRANYFWDVRPWSHSLLHRVGI